ncbi:STE3-domain-containing protein [Schizopora paradoxa]|uniref:STE3-domain-containing protein n=1 Tax=Schizopora paradoxa TaxID=27342 RepID=A0A0H2R971_9AGAM|nr:STE3-domain-containing protein [Schizopora paradoxa]
MYGLTPYPITPIGNAFGVVFALLPLVSQSRKVNLGIWGYAGWIAVTNFQTFVNTIIWHSSVDIVAPVWCDIVTKLQVGASVGTRTCALAICIHLYKITRLQPLSAETTRRKKRIGLIIELTLIIGIPVLVMALFIIVQPFRFNIVEEEGCVFVEFTYVTYIIYYGPSLVASLGSALLAPLTVRTFFRQRKAMNEFFSTNEEVSSNKYKRLMVIACLDILINLPLFTIILVTDILQGKQNAMNYPYISWKNVHDGAGGLAPGLSLSSILQTPASAWDDSSWDVFETKWNEWVFVLHALVFFAVFGTTPEMRQRYLSVLWYIPGRCGCRRHKTPELQAGNSTVVFNHSPSAPGQHMRNELENERRRDPLSFLETMISSRATEANASE